MITYIILLRLATTQINIERDGGQSFKEAAEFIHILHITAITHNSTYLRYENMPLYRKNDWF
jgi:hypothetical protein